MRRNRGDEWKYNLNVSKGLRREMAHLEARGLTPDEVKWNKERELAESRQEHERRRRLREELEVA